MNALRERDAENFDGIGSAVRSVHLCDFRNYSDQRIDLSSGLNIIAGSNAQGKTNFLEALYLVSSTRLLRGIRDVEAIRESQNIAQVTVTIGNGSTELCVRLERGIKKKGKLNGLQLPRAADLLGRLPCVCISAEDMKIVRGDPSDRRLFLDLELSQLFPAYLHHLSLYKRALDQRNALLKASQIEFVHNEGFEVWEEPMLEHGEAMRRMRRQFLNSLHDESVPIHDEMSNGEALAVKYVEKGVLTELSVNRGRDIERGTTTAGPHRDDLEITVNERDARLYGSQGQQRTAVIALKLGCLLVAKGVLGVPPLLLLDDILSDLDETRRKMLVKIVLEHASQAVLTCTESTAAGQEMLDRCRLFSVNNGTIDRL